MGYKLVKEVMDNAPRMSLAEWKAMVILAEDANDASRLTWSPTTAAKITRRLDLAPHAWANLRGTLVRKGLLEVVEAGRRGRCAKYRFPLWPQFRPQVEDETELCPRAEDETGDPAEAMSPPAEDETEPMCPQPEDASAEYVLQEVTPTHYYSSEQRTHQTSLSPRAAASPAAGPTDEREIIQVGSEPDPEEPQSRPQEQRPAEQPHIDDVVDAYAKARADIGKPATRIERVHIRGGAIELAREGQSIEYLVRLADWMGREHPGWTNLPRASTVPGSPPLVPGQRDPGGGHQTYKDPPQSAYYDPKTKRRQSFQNPTDPAAYEGSC